MSNHLNIDLKVCGITTSASITTAANNNIKSLGFASDNLLGPNTCNDGLIKNLIEECDYYKIESVLLSRHQSTLELVKQIDYTKPKIIACSYFFDKSAISVDNSCIINIHTHILFIIFSNVWTVQIIYFLHLLEITISFFL